MIRIRKPKTQPAPLRKKGPAAHKRLCDFYAQPRSEPPVFEPAIYNAPAVRQALHKAQHGKCAYCERKLVRTDGDVEHYRPKAAVQQGRQDSPRVPGYYWLAYKWSNLRGRVRAGAERAGGGLYRHFGPRPPHVGGEAARPSQLAQLAALVLGRSARP